MSNARKEYRPQVLYQKDAATQTWSPASVFSGKDGQYSLYTPYLDEAKAAIETELKNQINPINGRKIVGTRILERIVTDWEEVAL